METFDEATAKDLTTKTGLPYKSSFQKINVQICFRNEWFKSKS